MSTCSMAGGLIASGKLVCFIVVSCCQINASACDRTWIERIELNSVPHKVRYRLLADSRRHSSFKARPECCTRTVKWQARPALTTRPSSALHLNNSCILRSTSLHADPEVFLMLLHNSVWFCIATLRVSLYVTGEGYFSKRTGGHDGLALAPVPLSWLASPARMFAWGGGWRVLTDVDGGMMDWCFSGWMIDKVVGMGGKRQSSRECGSRGPQVRHSGANPGRAWLSLLQLCLYAFSNSLFGFLLAA